MHGVQIEGTMIIPQEAKLYLMEYITMQMEDLDDECLQKDLDVH